ncbi:hypothetical protein [Virgibacillus halodenitrificans]|uniref:hypothetical protein n=1 Tax=Virgibacillus halodenitrificans TaxID=1482 RepID=UPI000EF44A1A|nr:hypothetical protein [Virgibacillus halodenitrificans]
MSIDFSSLSQSLNEILFGLVMVLFLPFIGALVLSLVLQALKVPNSIAMPITILLFLFGVYQMFMYLY